MSKKIWALVLMLVCITVFAVGCKKTISISGSVSHSGNAVAGAKVEIIDGPTIKTVYTDANGNYVLSGLKPGNYEIQATHSDYEDIDLDSSKIVGEFRNDTTGAEITIWLQRG